MYVRPLQAFAISAALFGTLFPSAVFADSGVRMDRLNGTVGFDQANGSKTDVLNGADLSPGAEAYAGCFSQARVTLANGSLLTIGAGTSLLTPAQSGGPATLRWGALRFDVTAPTTIATKFGNVVATGGSGFLVAGDQGIQVFALDRANVEVGTTPLPAGNALTVNALASGAPVPIHTVNNAQLYQFNGGRNPLGTDGIAAPNDPTGSPGANCVNAPAGGGAGALGALAGLLAAGGVVAAIGHGGGGGGGDPTSAPAGGGTPTPAGGGTPTPTGGGTPTPSGSATPIGGGTPTPSGSATPIGGGTPTPTGSATPIGGGTPTPAETLGPLIPDPTSILLNPGIGAPATQIIAVTQVGYSGPFTASETSCLSLGAPPTVVVQGSNVVVTLPAQAVAVSLGCSVVITGGGGMTATVPVLISVTALGSPTPTPAPTATALPGTTPLTASPPSVLLNISAITPATSNVIITPALEGPFTAVTACALPLTGAPTSTVFGNVVTITAPAQVLAADVGCDTVVTSPSTGQSVTIPILVTSTAIGPSQPTPSPNPTGNGPLFAEPPSVLLNPGVLTAATQNILIYDHGFTGTYGVSLTPGCLALTPPTVALENGDVATITVRGQVVNVALLCSVTITDGTQTIQVPVTISATLLGLDTARLRFDSIAFKPPVLTFERAGDTQAIDVVGHFGPYRAFSACPAGASLEAQIQGERAFVRAATIVPNAVCMLTITGPTSTYGQVPIMMKGGATRARLDQAGTSHTALSLSTSALTLRSGEQQAVTITGAGPFALGGGCGRIAAASVDGNVLRLTGRATGTCSLTLSTPSGSQTMLSIIVAGPAPGRRPAP
jgi:hypothetical protein